jgi:hypothetical protein
LRVTPRGFALRGAFTIGRHGGARIGAQPHGAAEKYAAEPVSARMRHFGGYAKMDLRKSTARK